MSYRGKQNNNFSPIKKQLAHVFLQQNYGSNQVSVVIWILQKSVTTLYCKKSVFSM